MRSTSCKSFHKHLSNITGFSARRANFFSAVRKIFDLVSGFRNAKKRAQNRNSNEIFLCVEDIARWMSKIIPWSDPARVKTWETSIAVGTSGYYGVCMPDG